MIDKARDWLLYLAFLLSSSSTFCLLPFYLFVGDVGFLFFFLLPHLLFQVSVGRFEYGNRHFFSSSLPCSIFFVGGRGLVGRLVGFRGSSGNSFLAISTFYYFSHISFLSRMGWAFMGLIRWFLFCLLFHFLTSLTTTFIPIP